MKNLMLALVPLILVAGTCRADEDPNVTVQDLNAEVFRLKQTVSDHDKQLKELRKRLEGQDAKIDAILSAVANKTPATAPKIAAPVPSPSTVRSPVGHTHTCANGHQPVTWDHASNPTHNCPVCGLPQTVQDPTPRMVTTGGTQSAPSVTSSYYSLQSGYTTGIGSGGCANGQCGTTSAPRLGLFGRRR